MITTASRRRETTSTRRRGQRGSAAVEFALLVPVLFLILFGIIDYGLWFNDSLNVRQGVREGARAGVVQRFASPGCDPTQAATDTPPEQLACLTRNNIGALTGTTYLRITAPNGWARGKPLLVCGMVKTQGATGMAPMPSDGLIRSKTSMSIEVELPAPTTAPFEYQDALPTGGEWLSWCKL